MSYLSLEKCKRILNCDGQNFSDREIEEIRDYLTAIAYIDIEYLNQNKGNDDESNTKSCDIRESIHR